MAHPTPEQLADAQRKLGSALRTERDEAESALIAGRAASVPYLVAALEDDAPRVGGVSPVPRAALLLGALKAREALPALYRLVERDVLGVEDRPFVARALAEIVEGQDAFDDRARDAVEKLATDRDHYTRAFAAQAFGSFGDLRSKARVQSLAKDADPWVREKASAVLARLAELEAQARSDVQPQDFAALVAAAEAEGGVLKPYLDDLGDLRRAVRDAAVAELVRAGKKAVPFLLNKLNQPQTRARIGAATALGRLQATEAAGPLLVAATAPASTPEDTELRAVSLRALASCLTGMEEGLAASLLPLARDHDRFVRAAALLCLGRLADRAGLKAIVTAIVEDDPFVVESAAVALSEGVRETDVEIIKPLLLALGRGRAGAAVKEAILIALSRVPIEQAPLRVRVRHLVRREVDGQTASTRKASIVLLERLYADDDPPPLPLVDDVLARLADDHPEVRVVSASFVRTHLPPGLTGAVPRLIDALTRKELTVSLLVLEALRRHDTSDAKAAIEAAAQDEPLAERARDLLEGFEPRTTTWVFQAKSQPPRASSPARAETQRTTRVRPEGEVPEAERANVVEARFEAGDEERR